MPINLFCHQRKRMLWFEKIYYDIGVLLNVSASLCGARKVKILEEMGILCNMWNGFHIIMKNSSTLFLGTFGGFNPQIFDFVQKGFVADFQYFGGLTAIPAGFIQHIGNHFFFHPIHGLFLDFLQR